MDSTTSAFANTETPTYGRFSPNFSTTYHSLQSLKIKFSVCTEDYRPVLIHWTKLDSSIEFRKYRTKDLFVICFGLILMTAAVGESRLEVLDTALGKIFQSNSIMQTD